MHQNLVPSSHSSAQPPQRLARARGADSYPRLLLPGTGRSQRSPSSHAIRAAEHPSESADGKGGVQGEMEVKVEMSRNTCFYGGAFPRTRLEKSGCPGTFSQSCMCCWTTHGSRFVSFDCNFLSEELEKEEVNY